MPSMALREKRKSQGLCICGRIPDTGKKCCVVCTANSQSRRDVNKANGRCLCGNEREHGKRTCEGCAYQLRKNKEKVMAHYGSECSCCGENGLQFLAIDHVNGDGKHQRTKHPKSGTLFYRWIVKNDFPDFLQILCHNCNVAKGVGMACPHQLGTVIRLTPGDVSE